ncbi:Cyclohexanone 1,2-monooxygenase [compost metagenome]
MAAVKGQYDQIWKDVRNSVVAFGFAESAVPAFSVSEDERQSVFQKAWDKGGGFRFMFETFSDIATDPAANEAAASFVRSKIAEIVDDPETARKLTPTEAYAKRPLCDSGYYATFNRDNVSLIDVKATPIEEVTPKGVRTSDGVEHHLDILIFATGFDAVDGNYTRIDIRGRNSLAIRDHWASGATSYLGVATENFPNMFMILGPNGPFTNLPPTIEVQVEWIADLVEYASKAGINVIEATGQAENGWTSLCTEIADQTLFSKAASWIFGANIPGKTRSVLFYLGGLGAYRQHINGVAADHYQGFRLQPSDPAASTAAMASVG